MYKIYLVFGKLSTNTTESGHCQKKKKLLTNHCYKKHPLPTL